MRKTLLSIVALASVLASCSQEAPEANLASAVSSEARQVDSQEVRFAEALSRALSADASLRQLIKSEALKRFDNNTDVLYHQMKGLKTSEGKSVRELIQQYWQGSVEDFQKFEAHSPLLNIHLPDLSLFKLASANAWDAQSEEVGVALVRKNEANVPLFVAGDSVAAIASDEIPAIPTLVINQNKRVKVTGSARALNGETTYSYAFLDPSFDGSKSRQSARNEYVYEEPETDIVSEQYLKEASRGAYIRALSAKGTPALQRFYTYYPQGDSVLDQSLEEQILRFKVTPASYQYFAGRDGSDEDPKVRLQATFETRRQRDATIDEIIMKCWTAGAFTFVFDVHTPLTSGVAVSQRLVCSVYPKQLFVMNPHRDRRHSTWFRKTKYTYYLVPESFESRWVYPSKIKSGERIRLADAWDLSTQGLSKKIYIREFDTQKEKKEENKFASSFLFKAKQTLNFAAVKKVLGSSSAEFNEEYQTSKDVTYTVNYTEESDDLGSIDLLFRDPVIEEVVSGGYRLHNISNGNVTLTMIPVRTSWL